MAFYIWNQNNSGGSFDVDDDVSHRVVIEADSYELAEARAFDFGIYYNGVDRGRDCDCCGDRWYEGHEVTERDLGGKTLEEYLQECATKWGMEDPDIILHYADGSKKTFTGKK
jgi:hypothetical protein